MTRGAEIIERAYTLAAGGASKSEISRQLGASRAAIRDWLGDDRAALILRRRLTISEEAECSAGRCGRIQSLPRARYAYLLGLYLGDGCLSEAPRGVYKLRIQCCDAYPDLMNLCQQAMEAVMPGNKVGRTPSIGCTELHSHSKHWICLFPQHGRGRKHDRPIELVDWQRAIVDVYSRPFLRGLIHSDGCRVINRVCVRGKWYAYPRYFFDNASGDIRLLFGDACDRIGVEWRHSRKRTISVARRASVAILDEFIGPKS